MRIFLLLTVFLLTLMANGQSFRVSRIKKHIRYLASDKLEGRGTGSEGERKAAAYIAGQFSELGLGSFKGSYLRPFEFRKTSNPHDSAGAGESQKSANLAGFLDNQAPYTIVIGAHYDHLGRGHDHNSLEPSPEGKIHNGADDNASGTAGVIELARYFTKNNVKEPFNFLFLCFSGEELGLIGSKKWCEQPDIPLNTINYMVNMDMIGRLNKNNPRVVVYGVGTSPVFVPLIDSIPAGFSIRKDSSGIGPSDQTSFYLKNIPVTHFFTGQHEDYHKPSDDLKKVNFKGEAEVLKFIAQFIERSFVYGKIGFLPTRNPDTGKSSFKVTMGVMPDYTFEGNGMRIDGVSDNRPAFRAGIKKGDIVTRVGDVEVKNVQDYMKALSQYKKGDSAEVTLDRAGQTVRVSVTF